MLYMRLPDPFQPELRDQPRDMRETGAHADGQRFQFRVDDIV
jgi:hypothetical protein